MLLPMCGGDDKDDWEVSDYIEDEGYGRDVQKELKVTKWEMRWCLRKPRPNDEVRLT